MPQSGTGSDGCCKYTILGRGQSWLSAGWSGSRDRNRTAGSAEVLTAVSAWSPVTVPLGLRSYPDDYLGIMHRMAAETLAGSVGGLPSKYPDLGLELVVERGEPALLINRVAAHARLTIVGSHRRGAMARFLLGSTSEQVLARLATTTIVVR